MTDYDAVIVGAGPNGLTAAAVLARAGRSVLVLEANPTIGGGCRTVALTLPDFRHDVCAAIHPLAFASPIFRTLRLEERGLAWLTPPLAVAHPFDDGTAAVVSRVTETTTNSLGIDGSAWRELMAPFLARIDDLLADILRPPGFLRHPLLMARFGLRAVRSCRALVARFRGSHARGLFAGCAGHSLLSLDAPGSGAFGLMLALTCHSTGWPCARGGSQQIANALADHIRAGGGVIETNRIVTSLRDVPPSRSVLFDVSPRQLDRLAGNALPSRYRRRLQRFRAGPGVFKIDYALREPIPWTAAECRQAGTVHLGGTFEEIAESEDAVRRERVSERPFVLVAQQSLFDDTRAPAGHHTGWAYCHVPNASSVDCTDIIEQQIERFAPGFRDLVLARVIRSAAALEAYNRTMIGGDISGGANDLGQLLFRPILKWCPYSTPNPRLFLCSASTPPGGGVHGMCGYWAAQAVLRKWAGPPQS